MRHDQEQAELKRSGPAVSRPWSRPSSDVAAELGVDPLHGLDARAVEASKGRHGANRLRKVARRSAWSILVAQLDSLVVWLLAGATVLTFALGEMADSAAIAFVLLVNTTIGFVTERRAVRSMEALRELGVVRTRVRRGGRVREVPAGEVVVGDVLVLEAGDVVTADARILSASKLRADESTFTGESMPVRKDAEPVVEDALLADRASMLFKGTAITRGAAEAIVVAVGMHTELGHITSLVADADDGQTPLEKRLEELGRNLVWVTLVVAAVVVVAGVSSGKPIVLVVETAVALAVAAIPEGLPIVATMTLARGMFRMSRRHALVQRLSAVETLGATSVLFVDKTGTLTENRMAVRTVALADRDVHIERDQAGERFVDAAGADEHPGDGALRRALEVCALCNGASLGGAPVGEEDGGASSAATGDPMEVALLAVARTGGVDHDTLLRELPEVREVAFDPDVKMMATFHRGGDAIRVAIKGAPEAVLPLCARLREGDDERPLDAATRDALLARADALAAGGLRVLALAERRVDDAETHPYEDATALGLVGLHDPPRLEARAAIDACRDAGIRVVMVTGDQRHTARSIGSALGLLDSADAPVIDGADFARASIESDPSDLLGAPVYARFSPQQKLELIRLHQEAGDIVAMTGDGVNDAPALEKADIGVAMGRRGTQVARDAADMVLEDDRIATIVDAVAEGRTIFRNIRAFVTYLLSCNASEVLVVTLATIVGAPLPILPLQILFLNLVTDVFPALALAASEGDASDMSRPPRPRSEPVAGRAQWIRIGVYASVIAASVLTAFAAALVVFDGDRERAVTTSFLALGFTQLLHVFSMRSAGTTPWRNEVVRNPWVWGAILLCTLLLVGAVHVTPVAAVLSLRDPGLPGWGIAGASSLVPLVFGQLVPALSIPDRPAAPDHA